MATTTKIKVIQRKERTIPICPVIFKQLRAHLRRYERAYGLTSAEFYEKFKGGEKDRW